MVLRGPKGSASSVVSGLVWEIETAGEVLLQGPANGALGGRRAVGGSE